MWQDGLRTQNMAASTGSVALPRSRVHASMHSRIQRKCSFHIFVSCDDAGVVGIFAVSDEQCAVVFVHSLLDASGAVLVPPACGKTLP